MTGAIKSDRSATLNMEGVDVKLLLKFLQELPIEAQKTGRVTVQSTPGDRPWESGSESITVRWSADLGPAPAA